MTFLNTTITLRYPQTNIQLRTSSNPRNQATIQDGKVIVQNVQGRKTQGYVGNVVSGHIARQCTQPKRAQNSEWFKEKMLLAQAQEAGVALDEEQLAFFVDTGDKVDSGTDDRTLTTAIFQTDYLDAFDSYYDEAPTASVVFNANLSSYDFDVHSEFLPTDDLIKSLNKAMTFLNTAITLRYPQTNNQLRTSSNPRNQATIQDGKVTVQNVQGRKTQGYVGNVISGNATGTGIN
nr:hypothetical protein [Tanacetum cinerariifolium]